VRGIYATSQQDIQNLATADDGELVPAQGLEMMMEGGLDKAIAWWPIEPAVKASQQLYQQRDAVKQTIYEVTGLSDILRGASHASETATAQNIKNQWGSLRIQRMQADVQRFARDLFRLKAEIIATKFSMQNLSMMTGIKLVPMEQLQAMQGADCAGAADRAAGSARSRGDGQRRASGARGAGVPLRPDALLPD
jgi:hypothetical protein